MAAPRPPLEPARESRLGANAGARDGFLLALLASIAGAASFHAWETFVPAILSRGKSSFWFDSDMNRVVANLVSRSSNHHRTEVHPLFSILTHPPVYLLRRSLGLEPMLAVRLFVAAAAALWIGALYFLLRRLECRRPDAILFTLLGASSAAAMFWVTVPETYTLGSVTLLLALAVVAGERRPRAGGYVAAAAGTLSVTVTNGMTGLAILAADFPWRRALRLAAAAAGVVATLSVVQKAVYPSAGLPLQTRSETPYMFSPHAGGPTQILRAATLHGMIMPSIEIDPGGYRRWPRTTVQHSAAGSATRWGAIGLAAWIGLLGFGGWALFVAPARRPLRVALGASILGQLALHLVYGEETFLYTLHIVPLLVVTAALATLTRARPAVLLLVAILIPAAAVNNVRQLGVAAKLAAAPGLATPAVEPPPT